MKSPYIFVIRPSLFLNDKIRQRALRPLEIGFTRGPYFERLISKHQLQTGSYQFKGGSS